MMIALSAPNANAGVQRSLNNRPFSSSVPLLTLGTRLGFAVAVQAVVAGVLKNHLFGLRATAPGDTDVRRLSQLWCSFGRSNTRDAVAIDMRFMLWRAITSLPVVAVLLIFIRKSRLPPLIGALDSRRSSGSRHCAITGVQR